MTDVFILDFDGGNQLRKKISEACCIRWHIESDCHFSSIGSFGIVGKRMAERLSRSSIYVVSDNDCLILGENFVQQGLDIMARHPDYGLLAATSICDGYFANGYPREGLAEVVPRHAVGGVAFVRKGILTEFKPCDVTQVDETICHEMKLKGYKTGSMPGLRFNHIGAGYSITNPVWWMRVPE